MALISLGYDYLPKRSLLILEEELGDNKRIFAQMLGADAVKAGKEVIYVTPKAREDVIRQISVLGINGDAGFKIIDKFRDRFRLQELCSGDLYIVDGFSLLFSEAHPQEVYSILNTLSDLSRVGERIIILTSDIGVLPQKSEKMMHAMADGIIQFNVVYEEDRISRYINIPKLAGTTPQEKMISFAVDEGKIYIDTRERFG
jgi:KaiC/GvpD/RAD55 family RecA-like ATPase